MFLLHYINCRTSRYAACQHWQAA